MNSYQTSAAKRRLQFKVSRVSKFFNFRPKSVTSLAILMFFVIGAFYIVVVNVVATKGTDLRLLDFENRELQGENERLEVEAARLKSLKVINESATGEVEVGDEAANGIPDSQSPVPAQPVTMGPADGGVVAISQDSGAEVGAQEVKPKLVPMSNQQYLPSYSSSLAQR